MSKIRKKTKDSAVVQPYELAILVNYAKMQKYYKKPTIESHAGAGNVIRDRNAPGGRSVKQLKNEDKYNDISREIIGRAQQIEEQEKNREGEVRENTDIGRIITSYWHYIINN